MQTPPFDTVQADSIVAGIEAAERSAVIYLGRGEVTHGAMVVITMALFIGCACLWPVLAKLGCAATMKYHGFRERRKRRADLYRSQRKTMVDRARDAGL